MPLQYAVICHLPLSSLKNVTESESSCGSAIVLTMLLAYV
jgi:hypothetical protein